MKKYALFAGESYYPSGGWGDFVDSFDTVAEAEAAIPENSDWYEVVNLKVGRPIIKEEQAWYEWEMWLTYDEGNLERWLERDWLRITLDDRTPLEVHEDIKRQAERSKRQAAKTVAKLKQLAESDVDLEGLLDELRGSLE